MDDVAKAIESMPDWRFELIVANPEVELSVPLDGAPLPKNQILKRLDEAETLDRDGHREAEYAEHTASLGRADAG